MKPRKTKAERLLEERVNQICTTAVAGKPIMILDIPKVYAFAENLLQSGVEDSIALANTSAYVTSIQVA